MIPFSDSSDDAVGLASLSPPPSRLVTSPDLLPTPAAPRDSSRTRLDPLIVMSLLTTRDRTLIDLLDEHEVFTTAQVAKLCFSSLDAAQRRLLRLTQLKVLARFRWRLLHGSESYNYVLGPVGAAFAAALRDVDPPSPAAVRKRALRLARRPQLGHLLALNGWFCDLASEARARDGRLAQWWGERRCAERFGTIVHPDAAATYVEGERRCDFYFEYDNGTEPIGRVTAKLTRYGQLFEAGAPRAPVLIWCVSAVRERHLANAIAHERGAVWSIGGSVERQRLVNLAPHEAAPSAWEE